MIFMASMIQGISVILYDRIQTGVDAFKAPIFEERPVVINNVLAAPLATSDVVNEQQLDGKRLEYELCIPKGDTHIWENRVVEFFGRKWRTIGLPQEWIEENLPLDWNRKVLVERVE